MVSYTMQYDATHGFGQKVWYGKGQTEQNKVKVKKAHTVLMKAIKQQ